jgi:acylphosphatase
MTNEDMNRLHATVVGRVQGVSFRYYVMDQALSLDLVGWVRNRWNCAVEVTAEGPRQKLEILLEALRKGPPMAMVENVEYEWLPVTGEFTGFNLRSTE